MIWKCEFVILLRPEESFKETVLSIFLFSNEEHLGFLDRIHDVYLVKVKFQISSESFFFFFSLSISHVLHGGRGCTYTKMLFIVYWKFRFN